MQRVITIHVPGDVPLGIQFAHSAPLGLLVITSLPRDISLRSILQSGDAITSVAGVQLEPGAWDDALRQVREALKPRPEPRELQFVRILHVPTPLELTKNKAFRDRVKLPANMRAEHKSSRSISVGAEFIEAMHRKRKEEVQLFPVLANWSIGSL